MIIVFRFPFEGERRLRGSLSAVGREAVQYQPARKTDSEGAVVAGATGLA